MSKFSISKKLNKKPCLYEWGWGNNGHFMLDVWQTLVDAQIRSGHRNALVLSIFSSHFN